MTNRASLVVAASEWSEWSELSEHVTCFQKSCVLILECLEFIGISLVDYRSVNHIYNIKTINVVEAFLAILKSMA